MMKKHRTKEQLICEAIEAALQKGIKIWPGATFDWTNRPCHLTFEMFEIPKSSGELPSQCSAIGAVQLHLGETKNIKITTKQVLNYLNTEIYWLYKFHIGFDRGRLLIKKVKEKDKIVEKQCDVSRLGLKLRKKYTDI